MAVVEEVVAGQDPKPVEAKPGGVEPKVEKVAVVAGQEPKPGQKSGEDDPRFKGILADLAKERQARQRLETDLATHRSQLSVEQKRVRALSGLENVSPEEQEADEIRARIVKLFPVLGKLTDEQLSKLLASQDALGSVQETTQHYWTTHGRTMLATLHEQVAEEVGGDLNDRQKKALSRAYVSAAEEDPEFLARHERGDQTLLAEFAKQWVEDWLEPARRKVTQLEVNRQRRVPGDGAKRTVTQQPPKTINFKDPKAVEDAMVESFRSHGGAFENK